MTVATVRPCFHEPGKPYIPRSVHDRSPERIPIAGPWITGLEVRYVTDACGKPPAIDDERVRWHVGDVEDTLGAVDLVAARDAQWLVLFDLDIYEPTALAWEVISPHPRPGDVMYIDEPIDLTNDASWTR